MQLAPADTQLLADHQLALATLNHPHSFAAKEEAVFLYRHCVGRKLPSDTGGDSTFIVGIGLVTAGHAVVMTGNIGTKHVTFLLLPSEKNGYDGEWTFG